MITLTKRAIDRIVEMAKEEDLPLQIRLLVKGNGCAGFAYDMYFDAKVKDTDEAWSDKATGLVWLCDVLSIQYLDGTEVDVEEGLMGGGFKFRNPIATSICGCGNSFSVD